MKKIIGILGFSVIAVAMFFVSNDITEAKGATLVGLLSMNTANAETVDLGNGKCLTCGLVSTDVCVTVDNHQYFGYRVFHNC